MEVSEELVKELLRLLRKYHESSDIDIYGLAMEQAKDMSMALFGIDFRWMWITDFANSVLNFNPGISNKDFYEFMSVLGIEVIADGHDEAQQPALSE